jgi:hypothetical protein
MPMVRSSPEEIFLFKDSILICTAGFRELLGLFEHENEHISNVRKIMPTDGLKFIGCEMG